MKHGLTSSTVNKIKWNKKNFANINLGENKGEKYRQNDVM